MKLEQQPLMSIVVPVYNRAGLVAATLTSLAAQTACPVEVLLVDNNSTDGTYDVLARWAEAVRGPGFDVVVGRCLRPGAAAARNVGLGMARAGWVMFFDSDDTMPPHHVADALAAIEGHPGADIIGWDYVSSDGSAREAQPLFRARHAVEQPLPRGDVVGAVVRSDGPGARGRGWNEAVGYWDDIELGARMLSRAARVHYLGLSGVRVREHGESITGTYAADPARIEPALSAIGATLGSQALPDLKRAVEYGLSSRAGNNRGRELMGKLLQRNKLPRRLMLWFAYTHTRLGLRGAATLLKPLLYFGKK